VISTVVLGAVRAFAFRQRSPLEHYGRAFRGLRDPDRGALARHIDVAVDLVVVVVVAVLRVPVTIVLKVVVVTVLARLVAAYVAMKVGVQAGVLRVLRLSASALPLRLLCLGCSC
jgi:hypothetical protein